jgi:hypothetical protein
MIVANYWAEAVKTYTLNGRERRLRRFGWSDVDQNQAVRAQEAITQILAGGQLHRREPKVAYNGAEGVPIREEIILRQGNEVITRNSYGARCLNTPDILIADVDTPTEAAWQIKLAMVILLFCGCMNLGAHFDHRLVGAIAGIGVAFWAGFIADKLHQLRVKLTGGALQGLKNKIRLFITNNPGWNIRVYKTPAGFRLLVTHQNYSPKDPQVSEFFNCMGADRMYVKMCLRQGCFRARLSAKPWRMGFAERLTPRPGVWPIAPDRLSQRQRWVNAYETQAAGFAACTYIESQGSGLIAPQIKAAVELHDHQSNALATTLPQA